MKKILILTPRFPYPVIGGDKLRIYAICTELSKKYSLTLVSICGAKAELSMDIPNDGVFSHVERIYLPKWKSYLNTFLSIFSNKPLQIAYYSSSEFKSKVEGLYPNTDLVLAHLIRTSPYLDDLNEKPKILEMTDAISLNYLRVKEKKSKKSLMELVYSFEQERLYNYEQSVLDKYDFVSVVSKVDQKFLLSNRNDSPSIVVAGNGVDCHKFPFVGANKSLILVFIGNMSTRQNIDACQHFIEDIMPLLNEGRREPFILKIIGIIPETVKESFLKYPNVEVSGKVDIIAHEVRNVLCGVCAMRIGAGIQNKVLEYMAMGLPAVVSTVGAEGINASNNKDFIVANNPQNFTSSIVQLYHDAEFRDAISKNGRRFVENQLSWGSELKPLGDAVDSACQDWKV